MQSNLESVKGEQGPSQAALSTEYHWRPSRQSVRQPVQSNLGSVRGEQRPSKLDLTSYIIGTLCSMEREAAGAKQPGKHERRARGEPSCPQALNTIGAHLAQSVRQPVQKQPIESVRGEQRPSPAALKL